MKTSTRNGAVVTPGHVIRQKKTHPISRLREPHIHIERAVVTESEMASDEESF